MAFDLNIANIFESTPKLTDEEVKEGAPIRDAFRNSVLENQKIIQANESVFKELNVSTKSFTSLIESELAWLNANIEVSKRQIDTRKKAYEESYSQEIEKLVESSLTEIQKKSPTDQTRLANAFPFEKARSRLLTQANTSVQQQQKNDNDKKAEVLKKSAGDIALEAFYTGLKYSGVLIVFFFALRSASLAVNDILWKPLPYRILTFFYTFLFFPIWIPYYIVQRIRKKTRYEGFFPLFGYNPNEPLTLGKRLFGYANTEKLCSWITEKRNEWDSSVQETLSSTAKVLQELQSPKV